MGENTSFTISFSMLKIPKIIFPNFIYENDEAQELPSYPFQEIKLVRFEQSFNFYTHFTAISFKIQALILFDFYMQFHHIILSRFGSAKKLRFLQITFLQVS